MNPALLLALGAAIGAVCTAIGIAVGYYLGYRNTNAFWDDVIEGVIDESLAASDGPDDRQDRNDR